jgi:hypothetical protein
MGIVSEPDLSEEKAEEVKALFSPGDGFVVHVLPKTRSAWYPGSCVVIVLVRTEPSIWLKMSSPDVIQPSKSDDRVFN